MSLTENYLKATKKSTQIDLIELGNVVGCSVEQLCEIIVDNWHVRKGQLVNRLWDTTTERRHKWYAEFVVGSKYNRGDTRQVSLNEMLNFSSSMYLENFDGVKDSHISTFLHNKTWHENAQKTGSVSHDSLNDMEIMMPMLWLELDRDSHEKAAADALEIIQGLPDDQYEVFWSGNKSPHIAVNGALFGFPVNIGRYLGGDGRHVFNLAGKLCQDVRHRNGIHDTHEMPKEDILQEISRLGLTKPQDLQNFDPAIYRPNSLIRAPYSIHEKTLRKKGVYHYSELEEGQRPAKFRYSERVFDVDYPPVFLYMSWSCQMARNPALAANRQPSFAPVPEHEIREFYFRLYPELAHRTVGNGGWVGGLRNPFYDDTRASVSINLKTGRFKDWGDPIEFDLSFPQVYGRLNEIEEEQAKARLQFLDSL